MMIGLIVASVISGQVITRIDRYRFVGTVGLSTMVLGMWLLSQVRPGASGAEAVRDIVLIGAGLGMNMPLYQNAVQSAVPMSVVGVATSQVQFWRSMGGTVGAAVLGSVLAHRLPQEITAQIKALGLPPSAGALLDQGARSAQSLLDPAKLSDARASLPPDLLPIFDRVQDAIKLALANTLHDMFLYAAVILVIAVVTSVFLKDVPLRARRRAEDTEVGVPVASFGD